MSSSDDVDIRALRATWRYRKLRDRFMRENPLCAECERQGRVTLAAEMDHIIPASERPDLFWDEDNLQALCLDCHEKKTAEENRDDNPVLDAKRARFERVRRGLRKAHEMIH